jgi:hypothetical protein
VKLKSIRLWYRRLVLLRFFVMPFDISFPPVAPSVRHSKQKTRKQIVNYEDPGHFSFRGGAVYATQSMQANPISTLFMNPLCD